MLLEPSQLSFRSVRLSATLCCHLGSERVPVDLIVETIVANVNRIVLADLVLLEYLLHLLADGFFAMQSATVHHA